MRGFTSVGVMFGWGDMVHVALHLWQDTVWIRRNHQ